MKSNAFSMLSNIKPLGNRQYTSKGLCMSYWLPVVFLILWVTSFSVKAAGHLINLSFTNQPYESTLTLVFNSSVKPELKYQASEQTLIIEFDANNAIQGLPLAFSGSNLMKSLKKGGVTQGKSRLLVPVAYPVNANKTLKKQGDTYVLSIQLQAILNQTTTTSVQRSNKASEDVFSVLNNKQASTAAQNASQQSTHQPIKKQNNASINQVKNTSEPKSAYTPSKQKAATSGPIVIAIDAGHGGKDPGAIGSAGHQEKKIVFGVSKKLEKLLEKDPMFNPVLTRTGDYFISVPNRSEIARKQKANLLVSIHADAAPNKEARGASVWVLSNKRADTEMAGWLEKQEKQSELLGGAGDVLAGNGNDKYLSQAVIDLQFAHAQKVGYGAAVEVLKELGQVGKLHKKKPAHASLGVLRSPDIPSLLVEIGFVSNKAEEQLIATEKYQDALARAIYRGIKQYFEEHPVNTSGSLSAEAIPASVLSDKGKNKSASKTTNKNSNSAQKHKVVKGDSLIKIANKYNVSPSDIKKLNKMKDDNVQLGQTLKIPN